MIAYKGFTKDLTARLGSGEYQFEIGKTAIEQKSKTVSCGFHCCENPFECLTYYSFDKGDRFFKVEASGDIDEDGEERIACTELTLLEELSPLQIALEGMKYIIEHPNRQKWQQHYGGVLVCSDKAEVKEANHIAIARGENPKVKGPVGSILGIIREVEGFGIVDAKLFVPSEAEADKWLMMGAGRTIVEVEG